MKIITKILLPIAIVFYCACKTTIPTNGNAHNTINNASTAQDSNRLASYKGDTIAYINFLYKNQRKYIGNPLSILLKDLDLKIYQFSPNVAPKRDGKIYGVSLNTNAYGNYVRMDKLGNNQDIVLGVDLESFVLLDSIKVIISENGPPNYFNWSKKAESYFGKQIVKNILLYDYMKRSE